MKNFLYKIDQEEFILTPEEHKKVIEAQEAGYSMVTFRNDTLGINCEPGRLKFFKETNRLTEEQEKGVEKQLRLSSGHRRTITNQSLQGFQKLITHEQSDFKKCGACGEMHFLAGRSICIVCNCKAKNDVLKEVF